MKKLIMEIAIVLPSAKLEGDLARAREIIEKVRELDLVEDIVLYEVFLTEDGSRVVSR